MTTTEQPQGGQKADFVLFDQREWPGSFPPQPPPEPTPEMVACYRACLCDAKTGDWTDQSLQCFAQIPGFVDVRWKPCGLIGLSSDSGALPRDQFAAAWVTAVLPFAVVKSGAEFLSARTNELPAPLIPLNRLAKCVQLDPSHIFNQDLVQLGFGFAAVGSCDGHQRLILQHPNPEAAYSFVLQRFSLFDHTPT